jgi:hypothetical protein
MEYSVDRCLKFVTVGSLMSIVDFLFEVLDLLLLPCNRCAVAIQLLLKGGDFASFELEKARLGCPHSH